MFRKLSLISLLCAVLTAGGATLAARYTDWLAVELPDDIMSLYRAYCEATVPDRNEISELMKTTYCRCVTDEIQAEFLIDELILTAFGATPPRYQGQADERLEYLQQVGRQIGANCAAHADNVDAEAKSERP